jgi:hypothetical protein
MDSNDRVGEFKVNSLTPCDLTYRKRFGQSGESEIQGQFS